jgi:hypothetical protein
VAALAGRAKGFGSGRKTGRDAVDASGAPVSVTVRDVLLCLEGSVAPVFVTFQASI